MINFISKGINLLALNGFGGTVDISKFLLEAPVNFKGKGSRTRRKSAKVVTMSLEGGAPHPLRQLVTAWGCGADPPL